ncbi:hypothetical protein ACWGQ5_48180 [Streptomyces sp. NPDC055722]
MDVVGQLVVDDVRGEASRGPVVDAGELTGAGRRAVLHAQGAYGRHEFAGQDEAEVVH